MMDDTRVTSVNLDADTRRIAEALCVRYRTNRSHVMRAAVRYLGRRLLPTPGRHVVGGRLRDAELRRDLA